MHNLNPHVINSLLCLIGIFACLVLIACSGDKPERRSRSARRPAEQAGRQALSLSQSSPSHRSRVWEPQATTAPRIVLGEDESRPFRQVA